MEDLWFVEDISFDPLMFHSVIIKIKRVNKYKALRVALIIWKTFSKCGLLRIWVKAIVIIDVIAVPMVVFGLHFIYNTVILRCVVL